MPEEIQTIRLKFIADVNCYLLKSGISYVLIDSGFGPQRRALERELERAGCRPGALRLIILTHGDFDHIGSAAYLRQKYNARLAMHPGDAGMAEHADMFWGRNQGNAFLRSLIPILVGFRRSDRFTPDIWLAEGCDLRGFGLDAEIVEIPGHSKGSTGVLTPEGDFFCGDLFMNDQTTPHLGYGHPEDFRPSLEKIKHYPIRKFYPGHGTPFTPADLPDNLWKPG